MQNKLIPDEPGHIGTDESGKGDFFGPLVVAAFYMPEDQEAVLAGLGVRDCKKLTDKRVLDIAAALKKAYPYHSIVAIGPERYNALYREMRNLNRLLAWGHARAIENILEKIQVGRVITDQFGDERLVKNALFAKGRNVELIQMHRAEEDRAVAAASILARAEFLDKLARLSAEEGMTLPKGASREVEEAAVRLVKAKGPEVLERTAKTHFKTAERVLAAAGR